MSTRGSALAKDFSSARMARTCTPQRPCSLNSGSTRNLARTWHGASEWAVRWRSNTLPVRKEGPSLQTSGLPVRTQRRCQRCHRVGRQSISAIENTSDQLRCFGTAMWPIRFRFCRAAIRPECRMLARALFIGINSRNRATKSG